MEQQVLVVGESEEVVAERRAAQRAARVQGAAQRRARVRTAERAQCEVRVSAVDDLLPAGHRARAVWRFVERLDLSKFYDRIRAREGTCGRTATDPKVLLALWLYATSQGVGSARRLAELCQYHDAYRWLCGGVAVNYHTLADFRAGTGGELDQLLTQSLGVLLHHGLLRLQRIAQDGTKVRAAASRGSARRQESLAACLTQARTQVHAVRAAAAMAAVATQSRRQQAARARAADEQAGRVAAALRELEQLEADRHAYKRGAKEPRTPARVSTTDPTARKMRMGDGGYRQGYNVQLATPTAGPHVVVGVAVTQARTDYGHAAPMLPAIAARTGTLPEELLVDAGYTSREEVDAVAAAGVTLYGPLPARVGKPDPYAPQRADSAAMQALKGRMQTEEGKAIYRQRAASGELVQADLKRWRTLEHMPVRGIAKVTAVVLLNALTFNMLRILAVPGLG